MSLIFENDSEMYESIDYYLKTQSHILGLGTDESGTPMNICDGMTGQEHLRKSAALIVNLLLKSDSRRFILISGACGTGKTAISKAIIIEMKLEEYSVVLTRMEFKNPQRSKLETLVQALRKVIQIRLIEKNLVIIGEVVKISFDEPAPGVEGSVGSIILQTRDMTAIYGLDENIIESLKKLQIEKCDIISIESASGLVSLIGTTDLEKCTNKSLQPCPKGELARHWPIFHTVSLHDLDVYNTFCTGVPNVAPLKNFEMSDTVRKVVNMKVDEWVKMGKAEIKRGVVLVEEFGDMDSYCNNYLHSTPDEWLPLVILNTEASITDLPLSELFHKRVYKLVTSQHTENELKAILRLRCIEEKITVSERSYEELKTLGTHSTQCAVQLLQLVAALCQKLQKIPLLSIVYETENIIYMPEEFIDHLIKQNVQLRWTCEVTYEKIKTVFRFVFTKK